MPADLIIKLSMGVRDGTIRIGIYFFLLFTPFSSYMTILTHIYEVAGLPGIGPATLACNYTTFIISTFIAPILRFPLKTQLLMGGILYTLNYSSGILVANTDVPWLKFFISCMGSGLAGFSAGPMWVAQGRYIHLLCVQGGQEKREGQMFGIFFVLYCLSNISAGLITTFALGFFNTQIYFLIITILGGISVLFCIFCIKPIDSQSAKAELRTAAVPQHSHSLVQTSYDGSLVQEAVAEMPTPEYSPGRMLKQVLHFFPKMRMLLFVLVIDGVALGFYSSEIPHLIFAEEGTSKDQINKMAGYLMISLGIGSTLGSTLFGKIADKKDTLFTGRLSLALTVLGCCLFESTLYVKNYWLGMVTAFEWGFFLFVLEGWMFLVCGRHFGGKAQAFSVNKQLHSLFYLIFQLALIPSGNKIPLDWILFGLAIITIPTFWLIGSVPLDYTRPQLTLKEQSPSKA